MIIFKDGDSKEIHPIDYPGWEKEGWTTENQPLGESNGSLININNATQEELIKIENIGKVTANKIIQNRPYTSIKDLGDKNLGIDVKAIADLIEF